MVKRLLLYSFFFILLLAGCSDELNLPISNEIGKDGSVVMTLDIPSIQKGLTRADGINPECLVNDITILIFDDENVNTPPKQTITIFAEASQNNGVARMAQIDDKQIKLWFRINEELMSNPSTLRFYFIANSPDQDILTLDGNTSVIYRKPTASEEETIEVPTYGEFVMCGTTSFNDLSTTTPTLTRNAAKVSVNFNKDNSTESLPFNVFGTAEQSPLLSALTGDKGAVVTPTTFSKDLTYNYPRYIHPTYNYLLKEEGDKQTYDNLANTCYVIVKAPYKANNEDAGTDYFYRLDFMLPKSENPDKYVALSPTANHWYQFSVTEVTGPGYASPEEASRHPQTNIQYAIHDHSPLSFNMASDGIRELGVTHEVVYNGEPNDQFTDSVINIKFFSKFADEIPNSPDAVKNLLKPSGGSTPLILIEEDSWLELSDPTLVTTDFHPTPNGQHRDDDEEDTGVIYQFKLKFKSNNLIGTLTNNITVRWMGLERVIPVTWERKFNGADITTATISIKYQGNTTTYDYWPFLSSTDSYIYPDVEQSSSEKLWGIQPEPNNGKIRNQGFHFPVMYGSSGNYGSSDHASYSYTLKFNEEVFVEKTVRNVSTLIEGDAWVRNSILCSAVSGDKNIELTIYAKDGTDDYTYAIGKLKVKIEFSDGDIDQYSFDLYHTGFFHKDISEYRMDSNDDDQDWRYYEVVPIIVNGDTRYMLDRNLGAKSAEMFILNSDGTSLTGNPEAAGGYYKVAIQENPTAYVDPTMFDNGFRPVSPPGYCVPKQNVWDAIRNSSSFHTENAGEYFNSYYDTKNSRIGKIYFPKSMFFVGTSNAGETRDGYYWTSTAATGTEKEEIGRWLKMFTISGNTTSYTNGCVVIPGKELLAYGASLRCVNKVQQSTVLSRTSFNVSGATHVYLYHEVNGERIATTTWPGHAIGNYDTMTTGNWFGFSFESSDFDPNDLRVIFNFVDNSGIIHTFSQQDGQTVCTTSELLPYECVGWKVTASSYPNLDRHDNCIFNSEYCTSTSTTALGQWWLCDVENKSVSTYKNGSFTSIPELQAVLNSSIAVPQGQKRIFMRNVVGWPKVHIHSWRNVNGNAIDNDTWPGDMMKKVIQTSNEFWYIDIPDHAEYIKFTDGVNGSARQTQNIEINGDDTNNKVYDNKDLEY